MDWLVHLAESVHVHDVLSNVQLNQHDDVMQIILLLPKLHMTIASGVYLIFISR